MFRDLGLILIMCGVVMIVGPQIADWFIDRWVK